MTEDCIQPQTLKYNPLAFTAEPSLAAYTADGHNQKTDTELPSSKATDITGTGLN